ncbi:MAG: low specificity L-threonine aldolase [Verrucomicrobia bacterium]|nr:low specificity L-threonine aldolase [Verrucomicrobiota bacterium]MBI3869937.1 low specificity L-threonine aldolase [Verrucomicrobiota bacterium]
MSSTDIPRRHFASDNYAGVCPEVWEALRAADAGHVPGYGDDPHTSAVQDAFRSLFETDCEVHFLFTGTAANSLAIASACEAYHAVICHAFSHIETDESNAPGFFAHGVKTLPINTPLGKLDPKSVESLFLNRRDIHASAPKVLSLTQSTELGTVYTPSELKDLSEMARSLRMSIHMDGARFANAVARLGCSPADLTWRSGVDVLCFGGTKNGMLATEAAVFFNKDLAHAFKRRCKQAGQLASKMRYHAAQWQGMLRSGRWLENAKHANDMAQRLRSQLSAIAGIQVLYPVEANAVFVRFPEGMAEALLEKGWRFYTDVGPGGARLMCSWNTSPEDLDQFASDAKLIQERAR